MSELVADCPRCRAKHVTFDVKADVNRGVQGMIEWQDLFEVFGVCRACGRGTIFLLRINDYEAHGTIRQLGPTGMKGPTLETLMDIRGYVSVADFGAGEPPEYLPADLHAAFVEALKCKAVGCHNAAGAMFRLCLDKATRALLPAEGEPGGPNGRQRRDLGLRLPWLFANNRLPSELEPFSHCIREDGNDGAHAGTLTEADADDIKDFTQHLLERLYTFPGRLAAAATRRDVRRAPPP